MNIQNFISEVQDVYKTGVATEHSYRAALQNLFSSIDSDVSALNEPKRVTCGAPDFLVNRGEIVIGHVEAKDLGKDLSKLKGEEAEQKERYLKALPNLIYTNCLDFEFFRDGTFINKVSIGEFSKESQLRLRPDQYSVLEHQLREFASQRPQTIASSEKLAKIMAGKTVLIKDVLFKILKEDKNLQTELANQYEVFQDYLIHDITREDFADIYAETVAYGMFAARLRDNTLEDFGRQEALELLPKSNPFLRALFTYIASHDLDDRIKWIIDDLANVFQAVDVRKIMENFGSLTGKEDPFLHFYETFLAKHNPTKRKTRGVWYTPEPVVNFIVRAVDDVLKTEFSLSMGLADTSKIMIDWDTGQRQLTKKGKIAKPIRNAITKKEVHRVQILDPAAGTGTFLAEVIKQVAPRVKNITDMWSSYIEKDLIPRLHGFELLMASYAMCHMKIGMVLSELGYTSSQAPRLGVYLTNSLEEGEPADQTLPFARWLSDEAKQANSIKCAMPIMCVIGNPPYNPSSKNNNPWIAEKMADYKAGIHDRKVNLNDDYMKFIRLAENYVERNGSGIVAMITNNSFLDGTTQRGMRSHLMSTFDRIDVYNLHGDIRAQQADSSDQNIFDIRQGVAITIFVKNNKVPSPTVVKYLDLTGPRHLKYKALFEYENLKALLTKIEPDKPYFFFTPKTFDTAIETFSLDEFFVVKSSGIQTKNDAVAISWSSDERNTVLSNFQSLEPEEIEELYPSKAVWNTQQARRDILNGDFEERTILYRPFDKRFTILTKRADGFLGRPRYDVMQHISEGDISLVVNKKHVGNHFSHVFIADTIATHGVNYLGNRGQDYICPLYIAEDGLDKKRRVNFEPDIWAALQAAASSKEHGVPDEVNIFDYIYGILHSSQYREKFAEILKIGFPEIPWPSSPQSFWKVATKGRHLRRLHLMDPGVIGDANFPFKGKGNAAIERQYFENETVWINQSQYFEHVPENAWNLYIGGYQPAQKWLKDRKGRALTFDDIVHYQKIIKILLETNRIMNSIQIDI